MGEAVLVVRADAKGFDAGLKKQLTGVGTAAGKADSELRAFSSSSIGARRFAGALTSQAGLLGASLGAAGVGGAAAIAAGAIGSKLVDGFKSAIKASSDLGEQVNKNVVVFGQGADDVLRFGENAATSIGQSNRQALEATGTFGNLFRAVGITEKESAKMSTRLVGLASDLASFNNVDPDEALQALRSGLVGETEPLRKFGVQLTEARIRQEALNQGLVKGKEPLDASAKSQAAYALILRDTSLAQGDFANTQDSLANSSRTLSAQLEDLRAEIGSAFTPSVQGAAGGLSDFIKEADEGQEAVGGLGQSVKTALSIFGGPLFGTKTAINQILNGKDATEDLAQAQIDQAATTADLKGITDKLTESYREETKATEEQQKVLDEATRSQLERIKADVQARNAEEDFRVAVENVSEVQRENVRENEAAARSIVDAQRAVTDAKRSYEDARRSVQDMTRALEEQKLANERLKASVPRAEFDITRAREGERKAAEELAQAEADLKELRRFVSTTPEQLTEAERRVTEARLGVTESAFTTKDSEQALADLRKQIQEGPRLVAEAERDLADARQSVIDQRSAIVEAERGVAEARREAAETAAEGQRQLRDAQLQVESSAFAAAEAAVNLAREQAEANGKTLSAAEANRIYKDRLNAVANTLDPKNPLRTRLREYADEIKSLPEIKKTVIQVDTKDAQAKVDKLTEAIEGLAGTTTAAVGGDALSGGIEGATITVNFQSDIEGTATAVGKKNGAKANR